MKLRRYRNRALFDVERQKWVKLSAVARAVRAGEPISATDARSGADCTGLVLLQLLWERAMRGVAMPAQPLLEVLKATSASAGSEALRRLSEEVLDEERRKRR